MYKAQSLAAAAERRAEDAYPTSACSRRPVGDANKMPFEHASASHSEAATVACGIAVYTSMGAEVLPNV